LKIKGSIDIFISHAWRNHQEWLDVIKIINNIDDLEWRNFSVPWHDPALRPQTEIGKKHIYTLLKTQIIPCQICFIISDLYKLKGNQLWIDLAIEYANEYKVPIFYIGQENHFKNLDDNSILKINIKNISKIIKSYLK
jgi:hypothetical protein